MSKPLKIMAIAAVIIASIAVAGIVYSQVSDEIAQCNDMPCFSEHFADCKKVTFTTPLLMGLGAQAHYQILGRSDSGCQVQLKYPVNPNPAWVNKPVSFVLDTKKPFEPQMQKALSACLMAEEPGPYECDGPLRGIVLASSPPANKIKSPVRAVAHAGPAAAKLPPIADDAPTRFPVEKDGKWGYIDRKGKLVIKPKFEAADDFYEGLASVKVDGVYGYIDRKGKLVIKPQFSSAGVFSEGLAAVTPVSDESKEAQVGFIDRKGKLVIPPQFGTHYGSLEDLRFVDGLAPARQASTKNRRANWGFIDTKGQWKVKPTFERARAFSEGMAPVKPPARNWAFINPTGEVILRGDWGDALSFRDGFAAVGTSESQKKWAYIDPKGKIAVAPVFGNNRNSSKPDKAQPFSEGLGLVYFDGAREWQYITPTKFGDEAKFTTAKGIRGYDRATPFRGGLARVVLKHTARSRDTDATVYIDRLGNQIWPREDAK